MAIKLAPECLMNETQKESAEAERELLKTYMDVTGCTESSARSILMYMEFPEEEAAERPAPSAPR
jgi:hypothetical protein